jgi:hypothetical protein
VEEDWELVVGQPDVSTGAPQVVSVISPGGLDDVYAALEVNYASLPDYVPGGIQLQLWSGEQLLRTKKDPSPALLDQENEPVSWTIEMRVSTGDWDRITFEVTAGQAEAWGLFGDTGYLRGSWWSHLENLNDYSPEESVENSGVHYASNRVQSLTLLRVRYHQRDGDVFEDDTPRVVFEQSDDSPSSN